MNSNLTPELNKTSYQQFRKTSQFLMPVSLNNNIEQDEYNIYPVCSLGGGKIFNGYHSLAQYIIEKQTVIIDGYAGVLWDTIKASLSEYFITGGLTVNWVETSAYLKSQHEIEALVEPFLGTRDAVWGTKCTLSLHDLFELDKLTVQSRDKTADINIVMGSGATLSNWDAPIIYIDLPKNELQFRMRAGAITNLGAAQADEPLYMYKRFYFVDWVLLNNHKKQVLDQISVIADGQWPDDINWMYKTDFTDGLSRLG